MKKWIIAAALQLLTITVFAQLNINHYMRVGQTRISIGNYVGAIEYFNIVIRFKSYLPEPYFYRGVAKLRLEDFNGAIQDFDKAIEIKPYYPDAYAQRGMAYHEMKDFVRAIADYDRALELEPNDDGIYNNRGIAKISKKDIDGAIADYDKSLEINPSSTNTLMNRSNARIIKGDIRGAIRDLNKIIVIRPHYAGAYLNRGLARFEMNDYASALRDYDQCIKLEPDNALAFNNRGIIKQKLEDYNGAIMDYDMAIRLDPGMANAYFNRAMAREILKRPGYEKDYQVAADLNPQYDLSRFTVSADQMAKQSSNPGQQSQPAAGSGNQPANNPSVNKSEATKDTKTDDKTREEEIRKRRRLSLIVSDSRNLPKENQENSEDPLVQNRNPVIDLQPVFMISAFEKNSVNYERLQYFNADIELINKENNYNPLLTITNKTDEGYQDMFRNYILYFNEKITIAGNCHNYLNRGIFNCLSGNYNQALDDLNKAIELDSGQMLGYFSRANCRLKMIEHIETLPEASHPLQVDAGMNERNQSSNAPAEFVSDDYELILRDYNKTLDLSPDFFFGYFNRAVIFLKMKKYEDALRDLNKAIELESEFAEAFYNRGLVRIFQNDTKGGALDLSKAGELGLTEAYSIIKRYCN
jgi:tetratricopeptide (TPR) repeat protein